MMPDSERFRRFFCHVALKREQCRSVRSQSALLPFCVGRDGQTRQAKKLGCIWGAIFTALLRNCASKLKQAYKKVSNQRSKKFVKTQLTLNFKHQNSSIHQNGTHCHLTRNKIGTKCAIFAKNKNFKNHKKICQKDISIEASLFLVFFLNHEITRRKN